MFGFPTAARLVSGWWVEQGVETLSDHFYIRFNVSASAPSARPRCPRSAAPPLRWTLERLNQDALKAVAIAVAWPGLPAWRGGDVDEEAVWFQDSMTQVCDAGMPRIRLAPPRRAVYWWSRDIADLWSACIRARRQYTRCRRRKRDDPAMEATLYGAYREANKTLQRAIAKAKTQAWEDLLWALDSDPRGRPYRIVRDKLRSWTPLVTESLHPRLLKDVVSTLFPRAVWEGWRPPGGVGGGRRRRPIRFVTMPLFWG